MYKTVQNHILPLILPTPTPQKKYIYIPTSGDLY
jgi:hypothetical protein